LIVGATYNLNFCFTNEHGNNFIFLICDFKDIYSLTIKIKNLSWGQHWSILTFDVRTIQELYMKEVSYIDFPQHGEVFYFYSQALV
jgi:hypothetical protein